MKRIVIGLAMLAAGIAAQAEQFLENGTLTFSNLTEKLTYPIPDEGLTLRRVVSRGEANVTLTGTGCLTLTGGVSVADAAIENRALTSYSSGFAFNVPVELTRSDADGGVGYLLLGGSTFTRPVTLTRSTQPLAWRRVKSAAVKFQGAACLAEFSRAATVTVGAVGQTANGVLVTVSGGAKLSMPKTVIAKGSALTVSGKGSEATLGDIEIPDEAYMGSTEMQYGKLVLTNGATATCGRLTQGGNDGGKVTVGSGCRLDAQGGIELHAVNGEAMVVAGGTVRTPDLNVRGTAPARFTGAATLDVTALTTRVGRVTFETADGISATGAGAVEFAQETALPRLALGDGTALLFDDVTADRQTLALGTLELPKSGRARLCVCNRMLEGRVALATGFTEAKLAAMDVDGCDRRWLSVRDGTLTIDLGEGDLTQPKTATWTGGGDRGDFGDPANWRCLDLRGNEMKGAAPTRATDIAVTGETSFCCPAGTSEFGELSVTGRVALTVDCDWRGLRPGQIAAGTTIALNGHVLRMRLADATRLSSVGFGGSSAGELEVEVAAGETAMLNAALPDGVRLTTVGGGRLLVREDAHVAYEDFGAVGDGKADDQAAIAEAHAFANAIDLPVKARSGATYYIGGGNRTAVVETDTDFGDATLVLDDRTLENRRAYVFHVKSRKAPFTVGGVTRLSRGQRHLGVTLPCKCLVVATQSDIRHYIRSGPNANAGEVQHEVALAFADGRIDDRAPLAWDYDPVTSLVAYPIDERTLTIRGGLFRTISNREVTETYCKRGIEIARSNVRVEGVRHVVENEPPAGEAGACYSGLFMVEYCADVTIADCVMSGRVGTGTYDTTALCAYDVRYVGCVQTNDIHDSAMWGVMGSNYSKLLLYDRCTLSRFDAHQGVHNATIRDSVIGVNGVNAIGFGTFQIENSTICAQKMFNLRSDYGSVWHGEFVVRNCRWQIPPKRHAFMIGGQYDGEHDYGYDCRMPWRVTVDGLTVDNSQSASWHLWLFQDITPANTNAAFRYAHPYAVTERMTLRDVTVTSGKAIGVSSNPWMFRDVIVTNELPQDIGLSVGDFAAGWNWTNGTITVGVTRLDDSVREGRLELTVRDDEGHVVCADTRPVTGVGDIVFDVDLPRNGCDYSYEVKATDGGRGLFFATGTQERDLYAGTVGGTGSGDFLATVRNGREVISNGQWRVAPRADAAGGRLTVVGRAAFRVEKPGSGGIGRVEVAYPVKDCMILTSRAADVRGVSIAACRDLTDGDQERWMAVRTGADGLEWFPLFGAQPTVGVTYVVRIEQDFEREPVRVRYSVKEAEATEFVPLTDFDGREWIATPVGGARGISEVEITGHGHIFGLSGTAGDAAVAETDGTRYGDLNEALAAAGAKGTSVRLLADVAFQPDGETGAVVILAGGRRLKWTDGGGTALVRDPRTGTFRLEPTGGGTCANGLDSYTSAVLGLDADDAASKPLLSIVRSEDGTVELSLNVRPPAEYADKVRYRLEEADNVGFAASSLGEPSAEPVFRLRRTDAKARFYRAHIDICD